MGMNISKMIFWCCSTVFLYTYVGYPLLSGILAFCRRREGSPVPLTRPKVTIIVAAYNEGAIIVDRLTNIAEMDVSGMEVEVIVASDGSTDGMNEIVTAWPESKVRLLALPRGGRALAHNQAAAVSTGDILVFTDANTTFQKNFLVEIVRPFSQPDVGCVVGRLKFVTTRQTLAEDTGMYWKYETKLREWESRAGLLAVGSGCCMAVRKELFSELQPDEDIDDAIPLDLLIQGYRIVFASEAVAFDVAPSTPHDEIRARTRMTVLSLTAILRRKTLLDPFLFPRAAVTVLSHRVLRYLSPVFVLGGLASNAPLVGERLYGATFLAQALFYTFAFLGWMMGGQRFRMPVLRFPLSFCVWNIGFCAGLVRVLRRQTVTTYTPV